MKATLNQFLEKYGAAFFDHETFEDCNYIGKYYPREGFKIYADLGKIAYIAEFEKTYVIHLAHRNPIVIFKNLVETFSSSYLPSTVYYGKKTELTWAVDAVTIVQLSLTDETTIIEAVPLSPPDENIVTEYTTEDGTVSVVKCSRDLKTMREADSYNVCYNGVSKHGECSAEDVIRVLGNYLMSAHYKIKKLQKGQE
jgi:hypothetical protein